MIILRRIRCLIFLQMVLCASIHASMHNCIAGGISVRVEANGYYPGPDLSFSLLGLPAKYFGIGLGVTYTFWIEKMQSGAAPKEKASLHYWGVPVLLRGFIHLSETVDLFLEFGDGVHFKLERVTDDVGLSKSYSSVNNGLHFGGGVIINNFEIKSKFTYAIRKTPAKWLVFSVGFYY